MQQDMVDVIKRNPKYRELVTKRKRFGWTLAIIMLVIYYGFICLIAFAPKTLGIPMSEGAITTIGMPIGVLIILSAFVLTGIYVARANTEFDRLNQAIKEEV